MHIRLLVRLARDKIYQSHSWHKTDRVPFRATFYILLKFFASYGHVIVFCIAKQRDRVQRNSRGTERKNGGYLECKIDTRRWWFLDWLPSYLVVRSFLGNSVISHRRLAVQSRKVRGNSYDTREHGNITLRNQSISQSHSPRQSAGWLHASRAVKGELSLVSIWR